MHRPCAIKSIRDIRVGQCRPQGTPRAQPGVLCGRADRRWRARPSPPCPDAATVSGVDITELCSADMAAAGTGGHASIRPMMSRRVCPPNGAQCPAGEELVSTRARPGCCARIDLDTPVPASTVRANRHSAGRSLKPAAAALAPRDERVSRRFGEPAPDNVKNSATNRDG